MASIHKRPNSPNYFCAFILPDGRRAFRSTGTTDRRQALRICLKWEEASRLGREGRLTEARSREVIADIHEIANQTPLPTETVEAYLDGWLAKKRLEVADSSYKGYERAVNLFLDHLGAKAKKQIDSVSVKDVLSFRAKESKRVSGTTVNKNLRMLNVAWNRALREGLVKENVFLRVDLVKESISSRRAFTLDELSRILDACDEEWYGMVLFGLYTGQRLSDIAGLTWQQVDLETGEMRAFKTRKTGRPMPVPLCKHLITYLLRMPSSDNPDSPLFPDAHSSYARSGSSTLSRQFGEILKNAAVIARDTTHRARGDGRNARRQTGGLSFHCLRHTATSLLKNSGATDVIAREIIGHDSEAVSRAYTHIDTDSLRVAVDRMPDMTSVSRDARKAR